MATFNGELFLRDQLDSLCRQLCAPAELIVCDDDSTDGTVAILESYKENAPFSINVIRNNPRLGYKANFMKAASLCKGDIVAFCDQDDIWNEDKLCKVELEFQNGKCLLVTHDFSVFSDDATRSVPSYFKQLERNGFSSAVSIKGCTMAFKRDFIEQLGWPSSEGNWSHDVWVALAATALEKRFYICEPLIQHRIHNDNVSGWLLGRNSPSLSLRKIHIPPFTSSEPIDRLIDLCFDGDQVDEFISAISDPAFQMNNDRRNYIHASLLKKKELALFRESKTYQRLISRVSLAIQLFFSRHYRVGDGLHGLLSDFAARRNR